MIALCLIRLAVLEANRLINVSVPPGLKSMYSSPQPKGPEPLR